MAKFLLGFSLVLILATAALSYVTKGKIEALQGTLKSTRLDLKTTKATLLKTEGILATTQDELAAAKNTIEERDREIAKQKGEIADLNTNLAAAKAELDEKTKSLAELSEKLEEFRLLADKENKGGNLVEVVQAMKADLEKAQSELVEIKQVAATLEQQKKEAEAKVVSTQRQVDEYKFGIVRAGLSGKILAYNPGWNFVVLSIGDKQGVKANTQMLVMRGSQSIAKVKISSVEPATSIADVLPGSLSRGESVQPGDTVVYESKR